MVGSFVRQKQETVEDLDGASEPRADDEPAPWQLSNEEPKPRPKAPGKPASKKGNVPALGKMAAGRFVADKLTAAPRGKMVANTVRKLGDLLLLEKKTTEALVQYKRVVAIQDQLVAEHYEDPDFAADVAKVKKQIATCCR